MLKIHEIVKTWAADNNVSTVNRSYGEQTTTPVSVDTLENLVRSAMLVEREACANVCESRSDPVLGDWTGLHRAASVIRMRSDVQI